jgi:guanine deaminase
MAPELLLKMNNLDLHLSFIRVAVREATAGVKLNHGGPFGAVVVKSGRIIARAHNQVITTNDPTAHAEVNAIRLATKKLKSFSLAGCDLYTTCEPCPMCLAAILWARIDTVYYGCTQKDAAAIGFDDEKFHQSFTVKPLLQRRMKQVGQQECLKIMRVWAKKNDRVRY